MCFLKWIEHRHGLPRWHVACTQTHKRGTAITHPLISSIAASPSWVTETCSYLTDGPRASSFYWPKLCQSFFTSISVCACRLRAETVISAMQTNRCRHCTSHMSTVGEKDGGLWKTKISAVFCCFLWQEQFSQCPWMHCCSSWIQSVIKLIASLKKQKTSSPQKQMTDFMLGLYYL